MFEDGLSSSIRLHQCIMGHTTCLYMVDQFKGSDSIVSKNGVICKIVNR